MPKIFGREVHPIVLLGVTIVGVYLVAGAMQAPEATVARTKPKTQDKKTTADMDYTKSDYTAQFASMTGTAPKDAFKPLVSKATSAGNLQNPSIDNFTYSGMALLNGEPNGLLENGTTGEGDFVKPGQHWHQQWLVMSVTPEQIDLRNDIGDDTILKVGAASAAKDNAASAVATTNGANAPFNPAMIGQIGSGDLSVQADTGNPMPQQTGGRRRNRGGRGARGGGQQGGTNNSGN
ncbi:MAG: hypothetical protein P4L46_06525 [Fimbriimonas sp.]|nr:hypothetical protein [Fimbriimonas sp.]